MKLNSLLEYWKEILLTLSIVFGYAATISKKFRDTVTFWKTREVEAKKRRKKNGAKLAHIDSFYE